MGVTPAKINKAKKSFSPIKWELFSPQKTEKSVTLLHEGKKVRRGLENPHAQAFHSHMQKGKKRNAFFTKLTRTPTFLSFFFAAPPTNLSRKRGGGGFKKELVGGERLATKRFEKYFPLGLLETTIESIFPVGTFKSPKKNQLPRVSI